MQAGLVCLCLAVIALQAADGLSTYHALATGQAQENNAILVGLANATGAEIIWVVLAAKIFVAGLMFIAMRRTKVSIPVIVALVFTILFYGVVVAGNVSLL